MTRNLSLSHRWAPNLFDDLRKEMNRLMEGHWETKEHDASPFAPRADFAETDKAYEVTLDLPGVSAKDFEVEFKDGRLWISGERSQPAEEDGRTFHRVERNYGPFRRVVCLGDDVNAEQIDAKYDNGVLTITLPKVEEVLPKRIEVQAHSNGND